MKIEKDKYLLEETKSNTPNLKKIINFFESSYLINKGRVKKTGRRSRACNI